MLNKFTIYSQFLYLSLQYCKLFYYYFLMMNNKLIKKIVIEYCKFLQIKKYSLHQIILIYAY